MDRRHRVPLVWSIFASTVLVIFGLCNLITCMSVVVDYALDEGLGQPETHPDVCYDCISKSAGVCIEPKECVDNLGNVTNMLCSNTNLKCCVYYRYTCDYEEHGDVIYISNPEYPKRFNHVAGFCEVELKKKPFDTQQIKIDFIDFNLPSPSNAKTAICDTDRLMVTGAMSSDLKVCGQYDQQHLFYRLDSASNVVTFKYVSSNIDYDRSWKIKLSRVDSSSAQAPVGCIQYFRDSSGIIQTTNLLRNGRFTVNRDFWICIKRADDACSIKYTPCNTNDTSFEVIQPLFRSKLLTIIKSGPEIHENIPENYEGGCIRYKQLQCET